MDSTHSDNRPSNYDSSDEWEIGLGNLIIDLDADLEKDKQDGTSTKNGNGDSSPLRIGKMKIKRKVSSLKGDNPSSDSREACSSPEHNDSAKTKETISHSPTKGLVSKNWTMKGGVGGVREGTKGDGSNENQKIAVSTSSNEGIISKIGTTKSIEPKGEATTCKLSKTSEKSGDEMKKKEVVGKRSSDGCSSRKPNGKRPKLDKSSSCSIAVDTMDMGTITEPESLGPCEPGTAVTLEGIVWHENDQGVLVVNVTWRNKTYVGTLLDCSQHNWAPPRFCDSPTSDTEIWQTKSSSRSKRGRSSNNTSQDKYSETRSSMHSKLRNSTMAKGRRTSNSSSTGRKTPPSSNERISSASKRKVKNSEVDAVGIEDIMPSAKRTKSSHKVTNSEVVLDKNPDGLIQCPEPNCNKKYKHINGLRYHKMHAHLSQMDEGSVSPLQEKGKLAEMHDDHTFKKPQEDSESKDKCTKQNKHSSDEDRAESPCLETIAEWNEEVKSDKPLVSSSQEEITNDKEGDNKNDSQNTTSQAGVCKSDVPIKNLKTCGEESPRKIAAAGVVTPNADLSVFDFNPSLEEETETGHTPKSSKVHSPEKVTSSHQKPCTQFLECAIPKPESTDSADSVNSKETKDRALDRKVEKEKSKGEKHKRREKSLLKPLKSTTRPIAPAPPVIQQQLIAIPITATIVKPGTIAPTQAPTVTVTAMPAVTTKSSSVSSSNLKPIQPKPTIMGEPSTVNPVLASLKEKKQKVKKKKDKDKLSKDKDKREKEKKPEKQQPCAADQIISERVKTAPTEEKPKVAYISPVPEMNILKQALTSSISPLELSSPSMINQIPLAGPLRGQPREAPTKDVPKPFSAQPSVKPMGLLPSSSSSSSAIPEIPKLICVPPQTVNTSLPPYSIPSVLLPEKRKNNIAVSTPVITKTVQSSLSSIPSIPAMESLSIGTHPKRSVITSDIQPTAAATAVPDSLDTSRKTSSPAYSDISDEGGDSQNIIFHNAKESRLSVNDLFKMSSLSLLRGNLENERQVPANIIEAQPPTDSKSHMAGVMKPDKSSVERTDDSKNVRAQYNGQFAVVPPYFQMDSKQPGKGLHNYKHTYSEQQPTEGKKDTEKAGGAGPKIKEKGNHCSDLVEIKTITDPKDQPLALRIHPEPEPSSQRGDSDRRALLGPEKIPPSQTPRSQDLKDVKVERPSIHAAVAAAAASAERRDVESRHIVKQSLERKSEHSHTVEGHKEPSSRKEERREHSTVVQEPRQIEQRSTASSKTESEKRPLSHGQREKPSRSVSPGYRNSNWEDKPRYSASPSRSKSDRASERLQSPQQHGVPGYPNPAYIHNPYLQYGAIAYDPSHPAFNHSPFTSMVAYPAMLPAEVPYSAGHPHWQRSEVNERSANSVDSPSSSTSSLNIPSTSRTSEAHERPTKALDMFAPGSDSYSRHRPRSGSPDRGAQRASSSSAPKASSPMTSSKSPPRSTGPSQQDARAEMVRRHEAFMLQQQQMLHQHMHTHQHTHLGMAQIGFPGILPPPYDPYGLANHPQASGINPYAVRRE